MTENKHEWPADGGCLFGPWMAKTPRMGTKPSTQYRICVHPACKKSETREAPVA